MTQKSKLLLVDDDDAIQDILRLLLEKEGFEVHSAKCGKDAESLLKLEEFKVVLTDINMPGSSGVDLLKHITKSYPAVPTILMTGFTSIIETKLVFELGAKAFLAKPFNRTELLLALKDACHQGLTQNVEAEINEDSRDDYCRIDINEFVSGKTIKFEIFISLQPTKFIKVGHTGEDIDVERIRSYKNKGVNFLYIKKADFAQYVGFNLILSSALNLTDTLSNEKKLILLKHASAVIMEDLFVNGFDQEGFNNAKEVTESTLSLLAASQGTLDLLQALKASGDYLYSHCLGVSLYSAMIAKQIGWESPSILFKISVAGLFHDVGLKEIDRTIIEKSRTSLTKDEIKELETHTSRGAAILSSIPSIPDEVLQAILQHHESADGRGYPAKLIASKISQMARLVSVADKFCELALPDVHSQGLPVEKAIERLCLLNGSGIDVQYLNALKNVLGIPDPNITTEKKAGAL